MRQLPRFNLRHAAAAGLIAVAGWACAGCGTGAATSTVNTAMKAEHDAVTTVNNTENSAVAAANGAVQVIQNTVMHVGTIPQLVFDMAAGVLSANNQSSWGQPQAVVVTDTDYVIL